MSINSDSKHGYDGSIPVFDGLQACGPSYPLQKLGEVVKQGFCETAKGPWANPFCVPKPRGLVITSTDDDRGALDFKFTSSHKWDKVRSEVRSQQICEQAEIEKVYDLKYIKASSFEEVRTALKSNGTLSLVIFNVHGEHSVMHFGEDPIATWSKYPSDFFSSLNQGAKIVLRSCSTGYAKEMGSNIANTFAKLAPNATIYAPTQDITNLKMDGEDFVFYDWFKPDLKMTYKIDDNNRNRAVSEDKNIFADFMMEDFGKNPNNFEKLSVQVKEKIDTQDHSNLDLWSAALTHVITYAHNSNNPSLAKMASGSMTLLQIGQSLDMLASGALSMMATASCVGAIISGGLALFSMFAEDNEDDNSLGVFLSESFAKISEALSQIRTEMHTRFDILDVRMKTMFNTVVSGLESLSKQGYQMESRLTYSISNVEQEIISMNREMNYAHDENFLVPFNSIIDEVENYYERFNCALPSKRASKLLAKLESWLLNPPNVKGFNGSLYYDTNLPIKMKRTLRSSMNSICGLYVAHFNMLKSTDHGKHLEDFLSENIPNFTLWKKGINVYLKLRKLAPTYDIHNTQISRLIECNEDFIRTINTLCTSKTFRLLLVRDYIHARKNLYDQILSAQNLVKEEQEEIVRRNRRQLSDELLVTLPKYGVSLESTYHDYVQNTLTYYSQNIKERIVLPGKQLYDIPMVPLPFVDFVDEGWIKAEKDCKGTIVYRYKINHIIKMPLNWGLPPPFEVEQNQCLTLKCWRHLATIRENSHHLPSVVKYTVDAYFVTDEKTQCIGQMIKSAPNDKDVGSVWGGAFYGYGGLGSALVIIETWPKSQEISRKTIPCPIQEECKRYEVSPAILKAEESVEMYELLMTKLFEFSPQVKNGEYQCNFNSSNFDYEKLQNIALNTEDVSCEMLSNLHGIQVQLAKEVLRERSVSTSSSDNDKDAQIRKLTEKLLALLNTN